MAKRNKEEILKTTITWTDWRSFLVQCLELIRECDVVAENEASSSERFVIEFFEYWRDYRSIYDFYINCVQKTLDEIGPDGYIFRPCDKNEFCFHHFCDANHPAVLHQMELFKNTDKQSVKTIYDA